MCIAQTNDKYFYRLPYSATNSQRQSGVPEYLSRTLLNFLLLYVSTQKSTFQTIFSLIFLKIIFNIKISLLLAFCGALPVCHHVEPRAVRIRLIGIINLCDMCCVTIREKLFVHARAPCHKNVRPIIFSELFQKFVNAMHYLGTFDAIFLISRENDIDAVFQRLLLRKGFKCPSAHNDDFSLRHLSKHLLISRNAHQQTVL